MKLIKHIKGLISHSKPDLLNVFSYTAISTLVKMLSNFVLIKVVAVIIGPSGVALLGQLNNFSSIVLTLGSGGINSGVTKYVAEYREDSEKIGKVLSTSTKISILLSLAIGLLLILFSSYLSILILKNSDYKLVFIIFGFTLGFYTLNNQLLSILNGFKEFKKYVKINIFASVFGLFFTITLVVLWNLKGALIASISYQSVTFFISLFIVLKRPWFKKKFILNRFNIPAAKKLAGYSLMTIVTASMAPVSQILIRNFLTDSLSLRHAGIWEGMNRISGMYLMIITSSLSVYYLPKLSETLNNRDLRTEVFSAYKFLTPLLIIAILFIFLFKDLIISVLFTEEFSIMNELFIYQLIGDFFKMMAWILSFLMIAKAMTLQYIFTEIIFASSFVLLSKYSISEIGFIGASIAYMINYMIYFISMIILFRKVLLNKN